jgi:hypothetical protein
MKNNIRLVAAWRKSKKKLKSNVKSRKNAKIKKKVILFPKKVRGLLVLLAARVVALVVVHKVNQAVRAMVEAQPERAVVLVKLAEPGIRDWNNK